MPIHDFRCQTCATVFEALVRAPAPPACPSCGGTGLDRLVTAPVAPGRSAAMVGRARQRAAAAGHFSHDDRS